MAGRTPLNHIPSQLAPIMEQASHLDLAETARSACHACTDGPSRGWALILSCHSGAPRAEAHSATRMNGVVGSNGNSRPSAPAPSADTASTLYRSVDEGWGFMLVAIMPEDSCH